VQRLGIFSANSGAQVPRALLWVRPPILPVHSGSDASAHGLTKAWSEPRRIRQMRQASRVEQSDKMVTKIAAKDDGNV
jgi:hypothetical protein